MDSLVIGPPHGLADAIARRLRRGRQPVLRAIPADARDRERTAWLLEEAGHPELIVVVDSAPFAVVHELLAQTRAQVVLVAEQPAPVGVTRRSYVPREEAGLTVVPLGRAGRRWFRLGSGRQETLSAERAAAVALRSCGVAAASCR
ncbi:MAG: hypothetical protein ACR2L8_15025 [Solirubrobacteraceae bacterium]